MMPLESGKGKGEAQGVRNGELGLEGGACVSGFKERRWIEVRSWDDVCLKRSRRRWRVESHRDACQLRRARSYCTVLFWEEGRLKTEEEMRDET